MLSVHALHIRYHEHMCSISVALCGFDQRSTRTCVKRRLMKHCLWHARLPTIFSYLLASIQEKQKQKQKKLFFSVALCFVRWQLSFANDYIQPNFPNPSVTMKMTGILMVSASSFLSQGQHLSTPLRSDTHYTLSPCVSIDFCTSRLSSRSQLWLLNTTGRQRSEEE